jgi:hypothetical protein
MSVQSRTKGGRWIVTRSIRVKTSLPSAGAPILSVRRKSQKQTPHCLPTPKSVQDSLTLTLAKTQPNPQEKGYTTHVRGTIETVATGFGTLKTCHNIGVTLSLMPSTYFITGATGFVGGHLAEACKARGVAILTIARSSSDTGLLEQLGAMILRGDLRDADLVRHALEGVDVVVHCAAKVGD